jgi:hypothetical protein
MLMHRLMIRRSTGVPGSTAVMSGPSASDYPERRASCDKRGAETLDNCDESPILKMTRKLVSDH